MAGIAAMRLRQTAADWCLPLLVAGWVTGIAACVSPPYMAGSHPSYHVSPELLELTQPQIERGAPRPLLDAVGWCIGIPNKILLWNHRVANHNISPETEMAIAEYLMVNELDTVKVRLNQYAPLEDWQRLRANSSVGFGWRYSLGTLSWLGETIFPGRLWGYDHFNPFTNTVYVFSDIPAIGLHESGHAKDFARRELKGTYAAAYLLPGVPLWHEALATNDALAYLEAQGDPQAVQDAYHILYPAYGTYAGDAAGYLVPGYGTAVYLGGVLVGHAAGRVQGSRKKGELEQIARETPWQVPQPEIVPREPFNEGPSLGGAPSPYDGLPRRDFPPSSF